jgi:hypothetical protein
VHLGNGATLSHRQYSGATELYSLASTGATEIADEHGQYKAKIKPIHDYYDGHFPRCADFSLYTYCEYSFICGREE